MQMEWKNSRRDGKWINFELTMFSCYRVESGEKERKNLRGLLIWHKIGIKNQFLSLFPSAWCSVAYWVENLTDTEC